MTIDIGTLVVSTSEPSGYVNSDPDQSDWIWFNPDTGTFYKQSSGSWVATPIPNHNHGDTEFTGTISSERKPNR